MARFRAYTTDSEDDEDTRSAKDAISEDESIVEDGGAGEEEENTATRSHHTKRSVLRIESDGSGLTSDEDAQSESSESFPVTRRGGQTIVPLAQELGVDPQRMHVMQQSLFRVTEEAEAMREISTLPNRKRVILSNNLSRKHSRDSDGEGGLRGESSQRASFAHDIEPPPYRPSRKYARVESSASAVNGNENVLIDSGLSMGRSFRVCWGAAGKLVHLGSVCGPHASTCTTANSSTLTITTVPIFSSSNEDATERVGTLLSHHLTHTPVEPDANGVPFANPPANLTFSSFVSLFPSTDNSFEASIFRLGKALFDPQDLQVPESIGADIRARVELLRRKSALSSWLQTTVAPSIEQEIRDNSTGPWAKNVFSLLTGNQISKACDLAISEGNTRLATLLSQMPGDEDFRADIRSQLSLWQEQRVDVHIDKNVRKIYALLAGVVETLEGSGNHGLERAPRLPISEGLDWKRALGLHLWFGEPIEAPISDVFESYCRSATSGTASTASPKPWYAESSIDEERSSAWKLPSGSQPPDALYSLIRLHADPTCSLSQILEPFSFTPSPIDYRLSWHLYILLSRCLRIRDFADRGDPGKPINPREEDGTEVEGHSPSADLLANSYAMQLEQLGLIQEAAFVLLHLEGSTGRRRAIKELLVRSAPKLDDWMTRGLVGSLKIPMSWVNEAKAIYALEKGDDFSAYELYMTAGLYSPAHEIAVSKLAPDAVLRKDLNLLKSLFSKISGHPVDGWHTRGKLFLDYVDAMKRLPELRASLDGPSRPYDRAQAAEFEELTRSVPKLIALLPGVLPDRSDARNNAAISEMLTGLTLCLDKVRPLAIQEQVREPLIPEPTRLRHIHAVAYESLLRAIEVA